MKIKDIQIELYDPKDLSIEKTNTFILLSAEDHLMNILERIILFYNNK